MTRAELQQLNRGDIVRNKLSGDSYVIEATIGPGQYLALRSVTITNAHEWLLVGKNDVLVRVQEATP